ncbi:MAG: hypothetical protein JSR85_05215 [Proteobacteria bacterium]|nr:hypothetical protein [Pseudomonadota bacterium]
MMWKYLQKLCVLCLSFSLIFSPLTPVWAGRTPSSLKVEFEQSVLPAHSLHSKSQIDKDVTDLILSSKSSVMTRKVLPTDPPQTSIFRQTINFLYAGFNYVKKNPLKALVLVLTASIPGTKAVTASGLNQTYFFTEDVISPNNTLQPITVSDCVEPCTFEFFFNHASFMGPYGNLGFRPGVFKSNNNANVTITTGSVGDQYIQGSMAEVTKWLSSVYFAPEPNYDQNTTAKTMVWDNVTTPGTGPSGSITMTGAPVTDKPLIVANRIAIRRGQSIALTQANINGESVDVDSSALSYWFSEVEHGRFFLGVNPSADLTSVTQSILKNGEATFQHDGSNVPPSFVVTAFDGNAYSLPSQVFVNFTDEPLRTSSSILRTSTDPIFSQISTDMSPRASSKSNTKEFIIIGVSTGIGGSLFGTFFVLLIKWAYNKSHKPSSDQAHAIESSSHARMDGGYSSPPPPDYQHSSDQSHAIALTQNQSGLYRSPLGLESGYASPAEKLEF